MKTFSDVNMLSRFLMVVELLCGPSSYTISQIEKRTSIPRRTIYRYLNEMENAGIELRKEKSSFRIDPSSRFIRNLLKFNLFSESEAQLLLKIMDFIDEENPLKKSIREKLLSICNGFKDENSDTSARISAENISLIRVAIKEQWQVRFESYRAQQKVKDYVVEPFWLSEDSMQVWCFDTEEGKNKLFLTRRIGEAVVLNTPWQNKTKHRKGFKDVFNMIGDEPFRVKLGLNQKACNLLLEEYPLSANYIKKGDVDEWIFDAKVASVLGVGRFVIGMADCVKVYSSKKLVDYIIRFRKEHLDSISLDGGVNTDSSTKPHVGRPRKYMELKSKKQGRKQSNSKI